MAGSTNKKVVVWRFDRESLPGFINPATYLQPSGVELLSSTGTLTLIPYAEVKSVCFVKDWSPGDPHLERRLFTSRPKQEGLWVRLKFVDGESIDGLLANKLLDLEPYGFTVVPPDPSSNNQRMFIPRVALAELQVLGVVGSALRPRKPKEPPKEQLKMFD